VYENNFIGYSLIEHCSIKKFSVWHEDSIYIGITREERKIYECDFQ